MKAQDQYLRFVRWKEADKLYVGYCPDLFPSGGVCHGTAKEGTYRQLCELVAGEVEELQLAFDKPFLYEGGFELILHYAFAQRRHPVSPLHRRQPDVEASFPLLK